VYFRGVTRVDKVLESSNFGKPPPRYLQAADSAVGMGKVEKNTTEKFP